MQASDVKQRQKSSNKPQNGEKRRSEDEEKKKKKQQNASVDVKLCVSLLCLALSVLITWLHLQQRATLAEMRGTHEYLREKSRSAEQLHEKLTQVSRQLQDGAVPLRHALGSVLNTSAALQTEQDASSRRLHALHLRLQSGSDRPAVNDELHALKTRSRAVHGRVTEHVNAIDGRLREMSERLQEVQDGTRRNTRVLDRTEEEDAQRVREQTDWNARRISRLQEQLEQLAAQGHGLQKLESRTPRAQDEQLAAAEEAVRSMLRVRAHVSATLRRVQELELQVRSVEDRMRESRSLIRDLRRTSSDCALLSQTEALSAEVAHLEERFSGLSAQRQQLQRDLSALARAVEDAESRALLVSSDVTAKVASVRTDVRRMAGLETEVEALLNQTDALEEKVSQTEKLMVKRVGDLLAGSIDRVSGLKSSSERNGQRLDQITALVHQLSADNRKLTERILALESGQAKLRRTVTFADDLKPKVFTIRQDFALVEPRLADLTLRIGQLAEDMMSRDGEVEELREHFAKRDSTRDGRGTARHDWTGHAISDTRKH